MRFLDSTTISPPWDLSCGLPEFSEAVISAGIFPRAGVADTWSTFTRACCLACPSILSGWSSKALPHPSWRVSRAIPHRREGNSMFQPAALWSTWKGSAGAGGQWYGSTLRVRPSRFCRNRGCTTVLAFRPTAAGSRTTRTSLGRHRYTSGGSPSRAVNGRYRSGAGTWRCGRVMAMRFSTRLQEIKSWWPNTR